MLVSGPAGPQPLTDTELQTNGLVPETKTQHGSSGPCPPPATTRLSHPQNKVPSGPGQGRQHKKELDSPNRNTSASQSTGWAKKTEKAPKKSGTGQWKAKVKVTFRVQQQGPPTKAFKGVGPNSWACRQGRRKGKSTRI